MSSGNGAAYDPPPGRQEEAERWVARIDEWLRERDPSAEELEELRSYLERIATTFNHKRIL